MTRDFNIENFSTFFRKYLQTYSKRDYRVMKQAYTKYTLFISHLKDEDARLTPSVVRRFCEFLQAGSTGSGAYSTFARFKKVVSEAVEQGKISRNPCKGIKCTGCGDNLVKCILSPEEIQLLFDTHYHNENQDIRHAFAFCLYTGLRFCDIKTLKTANIDLAHKLLIFEQSKTKGRSRNSIVYIPLRDDIIRLAGNLPHDNSAIFHLPSHTTCLKHLKRWTKAAGIRKHITWHCARHSFATNILQNGATVKVVADLLGHSGLRYVEKYTRAIDWQKIEAINSLPPLSI